MKKIGAAAAALGIAAGLVAGCAPAEQQEITITQRPTPEAAPAEAAGEGSSEVPSSSSTQSKPVKREKPGKLTEVDGEEFIYKQAYYVDVPDQDMYCVIKPDQESFGCTATFAEPAPPIKNYEYFGTDLPTNAISYNVAVGFEPVHSPVSHPADDARTLAPGEVTTIDDYTFENQGSQVVVSRGAHTFTMANSQFTASTPPLADATKPAGNNAPEGSYCGSLDHGYRIIALADGTDCPTALATFEDYLSGSPKGGEPQGQAQFYTAPDTGWGCARGFRFPWEENIGANMKPTCSPKNGAGGSAAALSKEDVR